MATPCTGQLRPLAVGFEARISIDVGARKGFALTGIGTDEAKALERCNAMAAIANRLREAGHTSRTVKILGVAAKARTARVWQEILVAVDVLCSGTGKPLSAGATVTVAEFGKEWRSGDLHRKFPDRVGAIDHTRNTGIAKLYVDPVIGPKVVADVTLEDADEILSRLPASRAPGTRRHVAQYVARLLRLATYPGRLIAASPIPKGWLPSAKSKKAKECLYPDEDALLLAATDIPLVRRLAYGFLCREGMRTDELSRLTWSSVDLERGRVALDVNKTQDPRDWDLDPGVAHALTLWRKRFPKDLPATTQVFVEDGVPLNVEHLAAQLRVDLRKAGVTRPALFERSANRRPIRAHDLRATFVTVSLANGKTETWVADRGGWTTSQMINTYRRKARGWTLGALAPLDEAIPELASGHEPATTSPTGAISGHPDHSKRLEDRPIRESRDHLPLLGSAAARHGGSSPLPCTSQELGRAAERAGHEHGPMMAPSTNHPVEVALAKALEGATAAGQWAIVAQLAKELEARRLARAENVVTLDPAKRRR